MATIKTKPITLFVPFTKIERREADDALIVEGYCFVNPTVKGDRYSIKRSAMEAATPEYLKFPAVREMHQPIAAGTGLEVIWDEKGCLLRSECVDEGTKKKIEKSVLRGYSVGVNPLSLRGDEVESLDWVETSYVDRPKDPDAVFLYRADGFDPDALVDAEVLDEPPSPGADAGNAPAPDSTASTAPSSSDVPSEDSPSPVADGEPPPAAAGEGFSSEQRAQTSETVPVRENLEGKKKSRMYEDARGDRTAAGLAYGIEDAHYALMDSLYSILESDEEDKIGLIRQSAKQCASHIEEMCKANAERAAALERVIKHEGDKWVVYSESGKKLGEHDSEEAATKQLQAIEIEKHKGEKGATQPKDRAASIEYERLAGALAKAETLLKAAIARHDRHLKGTEATDAGSQKQLMEDLEAALQALQAHDDEMASRNDRPAQVSRSEERDDPTVLERLETANAELTRMAVERESLLARATTAEAEVQRLSREPVPQAPVARYTAALTREFLANAEARGNANVELLKKTYEETKAAAQIEPDFGKRKDLVVRMGILQTSLAQQGVQVD